MRTLSLTDEARNCRQLASEFVGKSERSLLLRAAELFEELAKQPGALDVRSMNEGPRASGPLGA
jgi:hypothetical protein